MKQSDFENKYQAFWQSFEQLLDISPASSGSASEKKSSDELLSKVIWERLSRKTIVRYVIIYHSRVLDIIVRYSLKGWSRW